MDECETGTLTHLERGHLSFGDFNPGPVEFKEPAARAAYSALSDAMSMEKRYFTSDLSMRS